MGLLCALYVPKNLKVNWGWSLIIFIFASLIVSKAVPTTSYEKLPKFKIPEGSVVLTQFDEGLYAGILHNPQVKFAPSMVIWATEKPIQEMALKLDRGEAPECKELQKYSFTHIQENKLKTSLPCLSLSQVDGAWRLWEIKNN
jgi:hypothetical protein